MTSKNSKNIKQEGDSATSDKLGSNHLTDALEQSANAFSQAINCRHDLYQAHYNLGIIRVEQNRFDEAVASFKNALAFNPKMIEAINNLGVAYDLLGKKRLAKITSPGESMLNAAEKLNLQIRKKKQNPMKSQAQVDVATLVELLQGDT